LPQFRSVKFSAEICDFQNNRVLLDERFYVLTDQIPAATRFVDFLLIIPAFVKKRPRFVVGSIHGASNREVLSNPRARAPKSRRNRYSAHCIFDSNRMHGAAGAGFIQRHTQEGRLLVIAFDQMNPSIPEFSQENRRDDPRETTAASEIDPSFWPRRQLKYLSAVGNMPLPKSRASMEPPD
jgi:hypothetical protein